MRELLLKTFRWTRTQLLCKCASHTMRRNFFGVIFWACLVGVYVGVHWWSSAVLAAILGTWTFLDGLTASKRFAEEQRMKEMLGDLFAHLEEQTSTPPEDRPQAN
jgi:hypothetical protein